jgi:hypothetical protein
VNQERDLLIQVTEDTLGPLGEIHPMLQHVTRSRRTGYHGNELNSNIGNEVESDMEIHWILMPTIKPQILQVSHKKNE